MRTPRLLSESSGETIGQSCVPGTPSSISSAPMRTIGSGSERPCPAPNRCWKAKGSELNSVRALARANAGALLSGSDGCKERCCIRPDRSMPHGTPRHSSGTLPGLARTILRSPRLPIPLICPCDNHCKRWASQASPTDRDAGCGSCDRAACRRPCRSAPACGMRQQASGGLTPSWCLCVVAFAYLSEE